MSRDRVQSLRLDLESPYASDSNGSPRSPRSPRGSVMLSRSLDSDTFMSEFAPRRPGTSQGVARRHSMISPGPRPSSSQSARPLRRTSRAIRRSRARHNTDWDPSSQTGMSKSFGTARPLPGRPATSKPAARRTVSMPPINLSKSLPVTKTDRAKAQSIAREIEGAPKPEEKHPAWSPLKHRTTRLNQVLYHFEDVLFKNKLIAMEKEVDDLEDREDYLKGCLERTEEAMVEKDKCTDLEKELQKIRREQALIKADIEKQERKNDRVANEDTNIRLGPQRPGRQRAYSVKRHVKAKLRKGLPRLIIIKQYLREEMTPMQFRDALGALDHDVVSSWIVDMCLQLKRLGKLLSLNDVITQSLESMEKAMARICTDACRDLKAERATLWAIDAKKRELYSYTSNGLQIRIPEDAGIAGACFQGGDVENIPDAYDDHRFNSEVDKSLGLRTKAILVCPVSAHAGYRIGCIQVMNKENQGEFSDEDVKLVEGLSMRAGIYLVQAQTYEEVVAVQQATPILQEVMSSFINEMKIQTALNQMISETVANVQCERATIWLADFFKDELYSTPAYGEEGEIRIPRTEGIAGRCLTSKGIIHVEDAYTDPDFNTAIDIKTGFTTRSILCVPIFNRFGNTLGVIQAMNKKPGPKGETRDFTENDKVALKSVAVQAGFNLEYARLYQEAWSHMSPVSTGDQEFPDGGGVDLSVTAPTYEEA